MSTNILYKTFKEKEKLLGMQAERLKAIAILEDIAARLGNEDIFDGEKWYDFEDSVYEIICSL